MVVHTFHGHVFHSYFGKWKTKFFIWIERQLAKVTDVIIVLSEKQRRDLYRKYKIAGWHKLRIIPLGFDLEPFYNCKQYRGQFRKELGIGKDTILYGIVGRLVPIKNHRLFLEIAKTIIEEVAKDVKFVIVGDGELRQELEEYSRILNI